MLKGTLTLAEKILWTMTFLVVMLIVTYALLGFAEHKAGDTIIGRFATWVNAHLRPQG
jgi:hypothetical protein